MLTHCTASPVSYASPGDSPNSVPYWDTFRKEVQEALESEAQAKRGQQERRRAKSIEAARRREQRKRQRLIKQYAKRVSPFQPLDNKSWGRIVHDFRREISDRFWGTTDPVQQRIVLELAAALGEIVATERVRCWMEQHGRDSE
jgi:hypothetical protein